MHALFRSADRRTLSNEKLGVPAACGFGLLKEIRVGSWSVRQCCCKGKPVLGRLGSDLLSHALRRSTIGAEGFHGRVRDGIGCLAPRQSHQVVQTRGCARADCPARNCRMGLYCQIRARWLTAARGRMIRIKPIERLVPVSFTHCCASTPGLSTWWSTTALMRDLVSRWVSRLDAFSGYPFRT